MTSLQDKERSASSKLETSAEQDSQQQGSGDVAEESFHDMREQPGVQKAEAERAKAPQSPVNTTDDSASPSLSPGSGDDAPAEQGIETVRRYHLGDPVAAKHMEKLNDSFLPALLHPYRDVSTIRYEYPLYLYPPQSAEDGRLAIPLGELLRETVEGFTGGPEAARILTDNLAWIERHVREELAQAEVPLDAATLLSEASQALHKHLKLDEANRERLQNDLDNLVAEVGDQGQILGYGPYVVIQLLLHVIQHRVHRLRQEFGREVNERIRGLKMLLGIERGKTRAAKEPEALRSSVGSASKYFDASALSGMLEQRSRGSVLMSKERQQRITEALETLEAYRDDPVLVRFVGELEGSWCADSASFELINSSHPCARAAEIYDREAARFAKVFAAARVARLEIDGIYDPLVHDSWFANFDWQAFSEDEVRTITTVVAIESAERIASEGLRSCSQLLVSGKPVQILTWTKAYDNPGAAPGEDPLQSFRFELAYFGIGHRQAFVAQSSAARHEDLLSAFVASLDSSRTALHLIDRGPQAQAKPEPLDPWIVASAALESRAHPFIQVNPAAGDNAADRVNFSGNPQLERDWPINAFAYHDEQGEAFETELAFTFVDYSLLMPKMHKYFRMVPPGCDSDDLVSVDAYLNLPADQRDRCVPFVWAIDGEGALRRLVVARALMLAARDRQDYWHTLQELAGVRNRYVELAIEKVRAEEQAAAAAEREQLQNSHTAELERVRSEAASEVMGQLAGVLLGSDLSSLGAAAPSAVRAPAVPAGSEAMAAEQPLPEPEVPVEEEEEVSFDDPWINSLLCTTCDDCMGVNKMMFVYNENKQATIADPKAGTFAHLVEAAEICPAKCIHPGKPLNPNEPDLDDLVKRAERFN